MRKELHSPYKERQRKSVGQTSFFQKSLCSSNCDFKKSSCPLFVCKKLSKGDGMSSLNLSCVDLNLHKLFSGFKIKC